MVVYESVQSN